MEQVNISEIDGYKEMNLNLPDVILVKKTFPKLRKRQKKRFWKLKHYEDDIDMQEADDQQSDDQLDDQEVQPNATHKQKNKRNTKKNERKMQKEDAKINIKGHKDYEYFLRDIEDEPELRANMNIYPDADIMAELEAKVAKMGINDEETSAYKKDLKKGEVKVAGQKRIVKAAVRKTAIGKAKAHQEDKARIHS